MIGSDILTEHHLTPRGWEAGNLPMDRVETWTRRGFEGLDYARRGSLALRVGFTGRGARRARRSPQPALSPDVEAARFPRLAVSIGAPL
jgi:hypothetical protein